MPPKKKTLTKRKTSIDESKKSSRSTLNDEDQFSKAMVEMDKIPKRKISKISQRSIKAKIEANRLVVQSHRASLSEEAKRKNAEDQKKAYAKSITRTLRDERNAKERLRASQMSPPSKRRKTQKQSDAYSVTINTPLRAERRRNDRLRASLLTSSSRRQKITRQSETYSETINTPLRAERSRNERQRVSLLTSSSRCQKIKGQSETYSATINTPLRAERSRNERLRVSLLTSSSRRQKITGQSETYSATINTPLRAERSRNERLRVSLLTSSSRRQKITGQSETYSATINTPMRDERSKKERLRVSLLTSSSRRKKITGQSETYSATINTPLKAERSRNERLRVSLLTSSSRRKKILGQSETYSAMITTPLRAERNSKERLRMSLLSASSKVKKHTRQSEVYILKNTTPVRSKRARIEMKRKILMSAASKTKKKYFQRIVYSKLTTPARPTNKSNDRKRYSNQRSSTKAKKQCSKTKLRVKGLTFGQLNDDSDDELATPFDNIEDQNLPSYIKDYQNDIAKLKHQWTRSDVNYCSICRERWPNIQTTQQSPICRKCKNHKKAGCYKHSAANLMDPGDQPIELQGLTMVEELCISQVIPSCFVFRATKGGQTAYHGNVINLPQDVHGFCTRLPRHANDLSILIIRKSGEDGTYKDFRVRRKKVIEALMWLKKHNKYYADIEIDDEAIKELPEDGPLTGIPEANEEVAEQFDNAKNKNDVVNQEAVDDETHSESDFEGFEDDDEFTKSTFLPMKVNSQDDDSIMRNRLGQVLQAHSNVDTNEKDSDNGEETGMQYPPQNDPLINWPDRDFKHPINEFQTVGYIARAFPAQIPNGVGDLHDARNKRVTPTEYFKHMMRFYGSKDLPLEQGFRFAKHDRFRYFAMNSLMRWRCLETGKIFLKRNKEIKSYTVEDLREMHGKELAKLSDHIMRFPANVRTGVAFWLQARYNVTAMVEQMDKLPTFFFTISSADLQCPDLHEMIGQSTSKRRAVNENPMMVDWFFTKKVDLIIKYVFQKGFGATNWWGRYEFQHRGSVHIHGLLWVDQAPDVKQLRDAQFNTQELRNEIIKYFDEMISCINPAVNEEGQLKWDKPVKHPSSIQLSSIPESQRENDFINLLNTVQRHTKCMVGYCKKTTKSQCRFGFPLPLQPKTIIREMVQEKAVKKAKKSQIADDNLNEKITGNADTNHNTNANIEDNIDEPPKSQSDQQTPAARYEIIMKRNDPLINNHNRILTITTRANTDIKPVDDEEKVIGYIVKYISKKEPKSKAFSEVMKDILQSSAPEKLMTSVVPSLMMKILGDRDYGAQETCHLLMGIPMYFSSKTVVVINLEGHFQLQEPNANEDLIIPNPIDKYMARQKELEDYNIFECYRLYHHKASTKSFEQNKTGFAIVRFFPNPSSNVNGTKYELYCKYFLMKRKPFRQIEDLKISYSSYQNAMEAFIEENPKYSNPTFTDKVDKCLNEFDPEDVEDEPNTDQPVTEPIYQDDWMLLCDINPLFKNTQESDFEWTKSSHNYNDIEEAKDYLKNVKSTPIPVPFFKCEPHLLNAGQRRAYDHVVHTFPDNGPRTEPPLRMVVYGTAGTGKSFFIRTIQSRLRERCQKLKYEGEPCKIMAPTGKAASLINGVTCHRALHMTVQTADRFTELTGERQTLIQEEFKGVELIIIDEMSMISREMLGKIDSRLRQAFPQHCTEELGGCSMILLGDFGQLPPVCASALYRDMDKTTISNYGRYIYTTFNTIVVLDEIVRQKDPIFQQLLLRLRDGQCTDADYELLATRFKGNPTVNEEEFKDAPMLHTLCDKVAEVNCERIMESCNPIAVIEGEHNNTLAKKATVEEAGGICAKVLLRIGAKIMLTANVWAEAGLCNGTIGEVIDIVYSQSSPPDLPDFVVCKIDDYTGPAYATENPQYVNIVPVERTFYIRGTRCTRNNYPIQLAWAVTVHKAQGQTLLKAILDIGSSEFASGITFVGISRVPELKNLMLIRFDRERLDKIGKAPSIRLRQMEDVRLALLDGTVSIPTVNELPPGKKTTKSVVSNCDTTTGDTTHVPEFKSGKPGNDKNETSTTGVDKVRNTSVSTSINAPRSRKRDSITSNVMIKSMKSKQSNNPKGSISSNSKTTINQSGQNVRHITTTQSGRSTSSRTNVNTSLVLPKDLINSQQSNKSILSKSKCAQNAIDFESNHQVNTIDYIVNSRYRYLPVLADSRTVFFPIRQQVIDEAIKNVETVYSVIFDRPATFIQFGDDKDNVTFRSSLSCQVINAKADGNCFYRSLALALFSCDSYHNVKTLRSVIAKCCTDNHHLRNYNIRLGHPNLWVTMSAELKWAEEREFYAASVLFNIKLNFLVHQNVSQKLAGINTQTATFHWISYDYYVQFAIVSDEFSPSRNDIRKVYMTHGGQDHFNLVIDFNQHI